MHVFSHGCIENVSEGDGEGDGDWCRYNALVQEKEDLEEEFESFRREVEAANVGSTSKEVRAAQKIIHNLEVVKAVCSGLWALEVTPALIIILIVMLLRRLSY